jgi:hypothetical protein
MNTCVTIDSAGARAALPYFVACRTPTRRVSGRPRRAPCSGERDPAQDGPSCLQLPSPRACVIFPPSRLSAQSDACLTVTIVAPEADATMLRPVMLWLHALATRADHRQREECMQLWIPVTEADSTVILAVRRGPQLMAAVSPATRKRYRCEPTAPLAARLSRLESHGN